MSPAGNLLFIRVGEEPKRRIQNNNKNKNQETNMAEKEDDFLANRGVNRQEPAIRDAAYNRHITTNKRTTTSKGVAPK